MLDRTNVSNEKFETTTAPESSAVTTGDLSAETAAPVFLQDVLAAASVANRCPSWTEYEHAAPCDQRAILARWKAIWDAAKMSDPDFKDAVNAHAWLCKATGERIKAERQQEGYAPRGNIDGEYAPVGGYADHEWGK